LLLLALQHLYLVVLDDHGAAVLELSGDLVGDAAWQNQNCKLSKMNGVDVVHHLAGTVQGAPIADAPNDDESGGLHHKVHSPT
jgi:hypothetical protein